jgi:hypothetical protein
VYVIIRILTEKRSGNITIVSITIIFVARPSLPFLIRSMSQPFEAIRTVQQQIWTRRVNSMYVGSSMTFTILVICWLAGKSMCLAAP